MVAFSRLQLAAALLEYDNDPDDPNPPKKAEESAIFSHIRTQNAPRARTLTGFEHLRETPNLLGVELPISDAASGNGSVDARRSVINQSRISRGSVDLLRNPFGAEDPVESDSERGVEEEEDEEDLEVDLEAWGMADFLGNKERDKEMSKKMRAEKRARRISRAQSEMLPNSQPGPVMDEFGRLGPSGHTPQGARSKSVSGIVGVPEDIQAIRGGLIASEADFRRRRSLSGPLDIVGRQTPEFAQRQRPMPRDREPLQVRNTTPRGPSPLQVPFPSSEQDDDFRSTFELPLSGPTSRFDPKAARMRTTSNGSFASTLMLGQDQHPAQESALDLEDEIYAAGSDRASRFEQRPSMDTRRLSRASIGGTIGGTQAYGDENPFSLPPPSPTRTSRFDPKAIAYTRTMSDASLGSRLPPDMDRMSMVSGQMLDQPHHQHRPLSRVELLRPKVLIMPSPLQDLEEASQPPPPDLPEGFQKSSVGLPLPPGAKANRPASQLMLGQSTSSNTLTPNPRQSLTLAQLTFRNSLMTGGQRDPAFNDIERNLRRAHEDGEQIYQEEDIEEEIAEEQKQAQGRAPGKLYGRSLMDELEARKEKMKSKQRVFTGDQRPSMMSRGQIRRGSTLIDPNSLERPSSQAFTNNRPELTRRVSSGSKPLLSFSNENIPLTGDANRGGKSVFGVDQLWERELERLKEIEAAEKIEEEERRKREERKVKKKAKKSKQAKEPSPERRMPSPEPEMLERPPSRLPELPPTLPNIPTTSARRPRGQGNVQSDSETDSEASEYEAKVNAARLASGAGGWESSDDEKKRKSSLPLRHHSDDSEDDVPLARVLQNPPLRGRESDSEDEQPLAKVLERKSILPDINFDNLGGSLPAKPSRVDDDDEDETPLGLKHPRASAFLSQSIAGDDEDDDRPLAIRQFETRQQGQQFNNFIPQPPPMMMMQPQMTGSMVFGAPSMMSGFAPFMPVMGPPVYNLPPNPVPDASKFASVDRWRRDVAAE